jgi:hypothetical protein
MSANIVDLKMQFRCVLRGFRNTGSIFVTDETYILRNAQTNGLFPNIQQTRALVLCALSPAKKQRQKQTTKLFQVFSFLFMYLPPQDRLLS